MGPSFSQRLPGLTFLFFYEKDYHLERIRSDNEMQATMKKKLDQFYFEFLIQKLMKCWKWFYACTLFVLIYQSIT